VSLLRANPNQKLEDLLFAAKQGREAYDREGWLNVAFFLNQQYTEWDPELNMLKPIAPKPNMEDAPRPVHNKIMHYVRTAHHDVLQDRPMPDVLPATDDYEDVSDSMVATAWAEWKADSVQVDYVSKVRRAAEWSILAGNGYLKWTWDANEKRQRVTAPSFFEIYLDPYAKQWDDVRYIIHSQFMDVEQVYDTFGVEVDPKESGVPDETKTKYLRGMGASPAVRGIMVHELWMKPSKRHPGGRFAVWAGNRQIVAPQNLPYKHLIRDRMLPFTCVGTIERPDSAYYMSPVTYLRPSQMEINKAHAQALMIMELFANPKWWIDSQLELQKDPDGSPGQILRGSSNGQPGLKPEMIFPPPAPQGIYQNLEMLEQGMMHLIGQHEVSNAQVPGRVESSKAIELLKESDDGALATLRETMNASTSVGWYQMLELQREFGDEEEAVTVYSSDGVTEVQHWRAGEMKPGYRVRTTQTTGLARSRTARNEAYMNLWREKVIQDPNQLLELLDVPTNSVLRATQIAQRKARSENARMAKGEAITPNSWDDHAVEIREHNLYRMTHAFESLDDDAKQKFEFHDDIHKKLLLQSIKEQAELQMAAQGTPAAPQGPVEPDQQPATQPPADEGEQ
jgi:hypothetical protein